MAEVSPEQVRARVAKGKGYTLVLLKAGPNRDMDEERANEIQMAHLQYLFGLIEDGVILINGPLRGNAAIRGISIYKSDDVEEVVSVVRRPRFNADLASGYTDPATWSALPRECGEAH
jgi:hypothetical protein